MHSQNDRTPNPFLAVLKKAASKIADFQSALLLSLLYILVVAPMGLFIRLFKDPLRIKFKKNAPPRWRQRPPGGGSTVLRAKQQF